MGQLDNQPENAKAGDLQAAEDRLRAMTQDIENLRQNLLGQLSQDVERLQREKTQLIEDIEKLQGQRQQQNIQQQQLVSQIAPDLANQLQDLLLSRLNQLADSSPVSQDDAASEAGERQSPKRSPSPRAFPKGQSPLESTANSGVEPTSRAGDYDENLHQLISSLDSTLRATFKTLQQDLSSYQSSLSQQLSQMYSLEQQGEAILETLVSRIKAELQAQSVAMQGPPPPSPIAPVNLPLLSDDRYDYSQEEYDHLSDSYPPEESVSVIERIPESETPVVIPAPPPLLKPATKLRLGFLLVLFSSLVLSFQNLVISVIFNKSQIFGLFKLGKFVAPSVGNSLLILWLRMLVVVPLMAIMVTILYPSVWRELKRFARTKDWPLFFRVVASGFFLFLSQTLIYLALGPISPGVAIGIFFIYPVFPVMLGSLLFGNRGARRPSIFRPNLFLSAIIVSILLGSVLLGLPSGRTSNLFGFGISAAVGGAIAFAVYILLAQNCARKLSPIPLSWLHFVSILVFSSLSLAGPLPESWRLDVVPSVWPELIISSLVLGGATLLSYLLNNIGLRMIDAARASLLGATVPALTALLAWVILQKTLQVQQIFGLVLITLGVVALSLEQWRRQSKAAQAAGRKVKY